MNAPESDAFVTTRWTQVLAARGGSESARVALGELCGAYYRPVLAFLRRTGTGGAGLSAGKGGSGPIFSGR